MSLTGILSIARTAMNTAQTAVQVASHNISNAQTEGYSRQTAVIEATPPLRYPYGSLGTGAQVATIQRSRDALLDQTYRTDAGAAAGLGWSAASAATTRTRSPSLRNPAPAATTRVSGGSGSG